MVTTIFNRKQLPYYSTAKELQEGAVAVASHAHLQVEVAKVPEVVEVEVQARHLQVQAGAEEEEEASMVSPHRALASAHEE